MSRVVQVEVLEIRPSGILVKILENNRVGFIHHRELSWDRSLNAPPLALEVGQSAEARIIRDRRNERYVYLSLRRLTDPWKEVGEEYRLDQVVQGEVVNVRRFAAFIQIKPGIDAIVWPKDVPLRANQNLESVLRIGDRVQGVINHLDLKKRKIGLSLTERLRQLSRLSPQDRKSAQFSLFEDKLELDKCEPVVSGFNEKPTLLRHYRPPIPKPEKVLVVDDNEAELREICEHLEKILEIEVVRARSGEEVKEKIRQGHSFEMAVIDLRLADESGVELAEMLLKSNPSLAVIFTSAKGSNNRQYETIYGRRHPFTAKEPARIAEWIEKVCTGYEEVLGETDELAYQSGESFVRQLGMEALTRRSLPEILQRMLERLRQETQVSHALTLEVDSTNKTASILAADPPLEKHILEYCFDGLYYSPVRGVVEDEERFYASYIAQDDDPRFKNFFPLLFYRSCLGIPLKIPDLVTRHALFLLDQNRLKFEAEVFEATELAGKLIQVALERSLLLGYMQRYEQRYSQGQLLSSLVHELSNKLDGLGGRVETLQAVLEKSAASGDDLSQSKVPSQALEIATGIVQIKRELNELVDAYSRLARGDLEAVDVNAVVHKVILQLQTEARDRGIQIHFQESDGIPPARAVQSRLEQIVLNLVLNAIQQIDQQAQLMRQIAYEKGEPTALLQGGQIIIQTQHRAGRTAYPVRIIGIDTGPGIHRQQQERIFLLETSTRQAGHGMGLFISRNMAETMGGRLRLVDSLMFIGSAFVVELPLSN